MAARAWPAADVLALSGRLAGDLRSVGSTLASGKLCTEAALADGRSRITLPSGRSDIGPDEAEDRPFGPLIRDAGAGSLHLMSLRRLAVACAGSLVVALLLAVGSAPAELKEDCNWGASSVSVELVNGQYVQSGPVATGCIPTRP